MVKSMVTLSSTGVCRVKQYCAPTATINVGNELGMDRKDIASEAVCCVPNGISESVILNGVYNRLPPLEVTEVCGFVSQSYLTEFCQMNFGASPGEIRKN